MTSSRPLPAEVLVAGACVSVTALVKSVSVLAKFAFIGVLASVFYVVRCSRALWVVRGVFEIASA